MPMTIRDHAAKEGLYDRLHAKGVRMLSANIGRTSGGAAVWLVTIELPGTRTITTLSAQTTDAALSDRALDDVAHRIVRHVTKPTGKVPAVLMDDETP
jgi:hypothetical protein